MTKAWLLQALQTFNETLNARQCRRTLAGQYASNCLGMQIGSRALPLVRSLPRCDLLRSVLCTALGKYLDQQVRRVQLHLNVYSASVVRGDGNWELAQRITVPKPGGTRKDRPYTCLLAWLGVDGALPQPPTPTNSEDITAILGDLVPLVAPTGTARSCGFRKCIVFRQVF